MLGRTLAGLVAAAAIALVARRAGSLSTSGAAAATIVGGAVVAAGWSWGLLLILYFVSSVMLSRIGRAAKEARTSSIVAKGGQRDAAQVFANGGLFALLALAARVATSAPLLLAVASLGALATATADTWATEVGTLAGGIPRSLLTLRQVPAGTSGGISVAGTAALGGGALFVAIASRLLGLADAMPAIAAGGVAGAFADTVLGGTVQDRRWCGVCERATERRVHDCGTATRHAGGLAFVNNDAVNFLATVVGAATAAAFALSSRR